MKTGKKQMLLSLFLTLCMVLTMLPVPVLAAEPDSEPEPKAADALLPGENLEQTDKETEQEKSSSRGTLSDISYIDADGSLQITVSAEEVTSDMTNLNAGWYIVNGDVTAADRMIVSGDVHLILADGCKLEAQKGIDVTDDNNDINDGSQNSLTIYAQSTEESTMGNLTAVGNYSTAGIGGDNYGAGGNITINGGLLDVTGGRYGAGIGGGNRGAGGNITINGGNITAKGISYSGIDSAGIGGGSEGTGGNITINGGTVTANGGGAGIGGGNRGAGGNITISGGIVTANGGSRGAGIGSSHSSAGSGNITISGGIITANGGTSSAGIGSGSSSSNSGSNVITISGGIITANGGQYGAGIGNGSYGSGSNVITISGGTITANGGSDGAGIGAGYKGDSGTFSTGENGNAFIIASSISDQNYKTDTATNGVIIEGDQGQIYGNVTLTTDAELPNGTTITIPQGASLNAGSHLTNNGTIHVESTDANALSGSFSGTTPLYKLTVNGEEAQYYEANSQVTPSVTPPVGQALRDFTGSDGNTYNATLTMPAYALNLTANYMNAPTFAVTIPAEVTLGQTETVSANGINLASSYSLNVAISGDFKLANTDATSPYRQELTYSVNKDSSSGTAFGSGDTVLTIAGGTADDSGSQTLYFSTPAERPKYSDSYTGTVTFTVSVAQNTIH